MKKLFGIAVIAGMLFCVAPASVYAGPQTAADQEQQKPVAFTVTSGMKTDQSVESTFDESRTISGSAEKGSSIVIDVYTRNASGELQAEDSYQIDIGVSGLFSQTIDLEVGENVVQVVAQKDGLQSVSVEATIKRKKRDIKRELENGISIPGSGQTTTKVDLMQYR